MTLQQILDKNITNGRFFAIEAETEKKRGGITYRKHSHLTAQFGCNYENLTAVKELTERGDKPSWFEHTEHNGIVCSKKDASKLYLQIMNPDNFRVTYTLADGTPVTKAQLIRMGALKDEPDEKPLTLVFALDTIKSITYKNNNSEVKAA